MGTYTVKLAGTSAYQNAIAALTPGAAADLLPEPDNPYDAEAIRCAAPDGGTIGYIPRDSWLKRVMLRDHTPVAARVLTITGGDDERVTRGVLIEVVTGGTPAGG